MPYLTRKDIQNIRYTYKSIRSTEKWSGNNNRQFGKKKTETNTHQVQTKVWGN